jgi:hypothetical protein
MMTIVGASRIISVPGIRPDQPAGQPGRRPESNVLARVTLDLILRPGHHLDLLHQQGAALRLNRQSEVTAAGYQTRDWGESNVEEIVENLQSVWRDRAASAIGQRGAAVMAAMTWQRQTELLLRAIDPLLP